MMNRRQALGGLAAMAGAGIAAYSSVEAAGGKSMNGLKKYPSEHFYTADGSFDADKARAAYFEMFEHHGYSLTESLREPNPTLLADNELWTLDFGLGDFSNAGMAGIFWVNDKEHNYFAHEIYLLPGQMIPEHKHLPAEGMPPKHECWQVRHGSIYTIGEVGKDLDTLPIELPTSQRDSIECTGWEKLDVGQMNVLNRCEAYHFMIAGPEGAIVSEYASFHSMDGLRFSNPKASLG